MNVWDRAGIELATPGSAVRHAYVARYDTDCASGQWFNLGFESSLMESNCPVCREFLNLELVLGIKQPKIIRFAHIYMLYVNYDPQF